MLPAIEFVGIRHSMFAYLQVLKRFCCRLFCGLINHKQLSLLLLLHLQACQACGRQGPGQKHGHQWNPYAPGAGALPSRQHDLHGCRRLQLWRDDVRALRRSEAILRNAAGTCAREEHHARHASAVSGLHTHGVQAARRAVLGRKPRREANNGGGALQAAGWLHPGVHHCAFLFSRLVQLAALCWLYLPT